MGYLEEAREQFEYMKAIRHELHMYPELSMQEFETTERIARELDQMGLSYKKFDPTGLMVDIEGPVPGKTVALRADIDALPMEEETGLPFSSQNKGVMHSCGHDVHTSMLLGAAKVILAHRDEIKGRIRLIFQPAEENGMGAKTVIAQGAAEGVDYFFGQHIMEFTDVGVIAGRPGPQMAGAEEFKLVVKGAAHHAGMPHLGGGVDATLVASEILLALQSIVSRRLDPFDVAVVSVGSFHSGTKANIISGEAVLEGTLRYQSEKIRTTLKTQMQNLAEGIAAAHGAMAEISYDSEIPPVINDEFITKVAFGAAEKIHHNPKKIITVRGTTGAEDFGNYSKYGRACFLTVGVHGRYPGHSPKLEVDENAMPYGCAMLVQTAMDLLNTMED